MYIENVKNDNGLIAPDKDEMHFEEILSSIENNQTN
jgi:hypothetical protein